MKYIAFFWILFALLTTCSLQAQPGKIFCGQGYGTGILIFDAVTLDSIAFVEDAGGYRMVVSPDGSKIYSTAGDYYVYITDPINNTFVEMFDPSVTTLSTYELEAITISPDGQKLYVFDESEAVLYVIDTDDNSTIDTLTSNLFYEPENCVISPDGDFLFMTDNEYVHKISTSPLKVVASYEIDGDAHGVGISLDGSKVYTEGTLGLYVFNAATLDTIKTLDGDGYFIEAAKDGGKIYAVDEGNSMYVVDGSTDDLGPEITLSMSSARGVTTNTNSDIIYIATSSGLIQMNATNFTEMGTTDYYCQSVLYIETNTTSVESPLVSSIEIYPNPATNFVKVMIPDGVEMSEYSVTNLSGKTVRSGKWINGSLLNISAYASGMYLLTVTSRSGDRAEGMIVKY